MLDHSYWVAMKFYISMGGDGFSMLKDCEFISDVTKGIETLTLLLKFFKASDMECESEKVSEMMS